MQFARVKPRASAEVAFTVDGRPARARAGDTLMTAILLNAPALRRFEFGEGARAGFCLMGACQDCFVALADGSRVRACTTLVAEGMAVLTGASDG
jgi:predicted molibdopterin-dependent oxidoreductase YjgC